MPDSETPPGDSGNDSHDKRKSETYRGSGKIFNEIKSLPGGHMPLYRAAVFRGVSDEFIPVCRFRYGKRKAPDDPPQERNKQARFPLIGEHADENPRGCIRKRKYGDFLLSVSAASF